MAHRALARALHFLLGHTGAAFLANLAAFFMLLPPIALLRPSTPLPLTVVALWSWLVFSGLCAWVADTARGQSKGGHGAFVGYWFRFMAWRRGLAGVVFVGFGLASALAFWFWGAAFQAPLAIKVPLLAINGSLALWGGLAALAAFGFGAEPGCGVWDQLKRAAFAPVAFLPAMVFALVLSAWLSGGIGLAALAAFPKVSRWLLLPVLLPMAFLPAFTLVGLAAFLAFLAEELQLASLDLPSSQPRLPSLREFFMPWE